MKGIDYSAKSFILIILIVLCGLSVPAFTQEEEFMTRVDVRPYNTDIDPDIDFYIRNWSEATAFKTHGSLSSGKSSLMAIPVNRKERHGVSVCEPFFPCGFVCLQRHGTINAERGAGDILFTLERRGLPQQRVRLGKAPVSSC